mgnify:CR=1 FL=1
MSDIETRLTNVLRERADAVDFDAAEWTARVEGAPAGTSPAAVRISTSAP